MEQRHRQKHPRASTEDILGTTQQDAEPQIPDKWRPYYDQLIQLRRQLNRRQDRLMGDAVQPQENLSEHIADAGTDEFDRDLALGMASNEQETLYEIEEALRRMQDGRYGICEATGEQIPPQRLKAIPWTRFSKEMEQKLEDTGEVQTAKIGDVEFIARRPTHNSLGDSVEDSPVPSAKAHKKKKPKS